MPKVKWETYFCLGGRNCKAGCFNHYFLRQAPDHHFIDIIIFTSKGCYLLIIAHHLPFRLAQVTTTMLGVCRFIKVMNPFYNISNKTIIVYLFLHVGYMFVQVTICCSFVCVIVLQTFVYLNFVSILDFRTVTYSCVSWAFPIVHCRHSRRLFCAFHNNDSVL